MRGVSVIKMTNQKTVFGIQGMTCVSCSLTIESVLRDVEGVLAANVDFNAARAVVEFDAAKTSEQQLMGVIREVGYTATPLAPSSTVSSAVAQPTLGGTGNLVSSASGLLATLGSSFQLCHTLCLTLMAMLATIGIVGIGFPLLFLVDYGIYFWGFALLLLVPALLMRLANSRCGSTQVLLFNVGVVIAGTPPQFTFGFQPLFWGIGGALVLAGLLGWLSKRRFRLPFMRNSGGESHG